MNENVKKKRKIHTRDKRYHAMGKKLREMSRMLTGDRKLFPLRVVKNTLDTSEKES